MLVMAPKSFLTFLTSPHPLPPPSPPKSNSKQLLMVADTLTLTQTLTLVRTRSTAIHEIVSPSFLPSPSPHRRLRRLSSVNQLQNGATSGTTHTHTHTLSTVDTALMMTLVTPAAAAAVDAAFAEVDQVRAVQESLL